VKTNPAYIFLLLVINGFVIVSSAQNRIELKPILSENIKKNKIDVFVEVDSLQKQPEAGLLFNLILKNYSDSAITIVNPAEMLHPLLLNDSKVDIIYPHRPRGLICVKGPYDYFYTAFNIEKITVNNVTTEINLAEKTYITIPSKTEYKIFFKIRNVLPPNATKPYHYAETVKIPDGKYSFSLVTAILVQQKVDFYTMKPLRIDYSTSEKNELVIIRNSRREKEQRPFNRVSQTGYSFSPNQLSLPAHARNKPLFRPAK